MMSDSQDRLKRAEESGRVIRKVKSFVLRQGRLTNAQETAIKDHWSEYGLEYKNEKFNWSEIFGNDNPIVFEIGFGMGGSLIKMAQAEPNKNFVGMEVHLPGVGACIKDAAELKVPNLKVINHDAVEVLNHCVPDNSLEKLQLFFPDPWHKKRHHKRRIVQPEFAQLIRTKLSLGGVFHMATDWENYAEHMLEVMSNEAGYKNQSETQDYIPRPEFRPLTKFEERGHRLGHGVWDLIFEKIS
ncbi:tRNA (guanosine(46)-N7)-methyltransferase TrmB [Catenovulum maritimum]|uniref:tRNA (guanine-N(7)-)-methyltransferase n=1 Tax=Catenovulum maritimum TaxID=1513271 RepID=A0A0J8GV18_9ALTE|nr:tRNA (guanine-N7)-methyltransferase [Catenovulum maritimum]